MDKCALYIVRDQYSGAVKIGISKHPKKRLQQIADHYNVGRVSLLKTTWFTTRDTARSWESNFHKRYAANKSPEQGGREWFDLTDAQINGFIDWMEASTNKRAVKVVTVLASAWKSEQEIGKHRVQAFIGGTALAFFTGLIPALAFAFTDEPAAAFIAPAACGGAAVFGVSKKKEHSMTYGLDGQPIGSEVPEDQYRQMGLWKERYTSLEGIKPVGWELPKATTSESATRLYQQGH
ncbi:T5orf172 domain protein [Synechococcus sp. MIT S9509]|uniref:GIY-YIG nuclease family protein n=1 Tax=Synechococcus sp. MIT S9509 TaxID=1801630 RepID=UPI0007BC4F23|nr:GIY-YIG nuclease family protein [Synechococcus sp. MIT S9509]KZR92380.1 T5orf172 domain protein [Synechococcus sp. MIT S9509]